MNLLTRRVKNVKSYERKGAMVIATVRAHKLTAHKAHVGFEMKVLGGFANDGMRAHSPTTAQPTKPLKLVIVEGSTPGAGRKM